MMAGVKIESTDMFASVGLVMRTLTVEQVRLDYISGRRDVALVACSPQEFELCWSRYEVCPMQGI